MLFGADDDPKSSESPTTDTLKFFTGEEDTGESAPALTTDKSALPKQASQTATADELLVPEGSPFFEDPETSGSTEAGGPPLAVKEAYHALVQHEIVDFRRRPQPGMC